MSTGPDRARLSIDIDADLRRRIKIAAAERDLSIRDLVVSILTNALAASESAERQAWSALSTRSFARDWESESDQAYDALGQG